MALFPSRAAATGFSPRAAWQPRVGTYPGDPAGGPTLLDMLARPMPPEMPPFMPGPPQAPAPQAPPLTAGSVPFQAEGSPGPAGVEANNWGVDIGRDLGMGWDAMIGPALTMAGFPGSALGLLAGMVYDNERGKQIGTTTSITDIALQALNLPTTRDMLTGVINPPAPATPSLSAQAFEAGIVGTPGYSGGYDAFGQPSLDPGVPAGLSPDEAAAMAAQMGRGGMTAGTWGDLGDWGGWGGGGGGGIGGGIGGGMASAEQGGGYGLGGGEYGGDAFGLMTGGYAGGGPDGVVQPHKPAGTFHEGEGILNAAAMRHYGDAGRKAVAAINARSVPKNRLAALVRG